MEKFKGTKGEWKACAKHQTILDENDYGIAQIHGILNENEWEANAKLIADAGTTVNQCGIIPSELLKQRNELVEALQSAITLLYGTTEFEVIETYRKRVNDFEQIIKKANEQ